MIIEEGWKISMTKLLVKLFIKNASDYQNTKVRTAYGVMASMVGIVCNLLLFAVKFVIGILIQSISVTADAFNNLSDSASSLISLIGVKLASRPADKEHPFGHGRYEYIAALVVSFLVLQVGFSCIKSSFKKIIRPEQTQFRLVLVIILCASVLVKIWLSRFNRTLGKRISSSVMKAAAADAFGDVMITLATIVSLVISHATGLRIDGYVGMTVSVFVLISGINIAKETFEPLLGEAIDKETYQNITQKIMSYPNIVGTHDLIVHSYGPSHKMATVHCEVPNSISIEEAHDIIDQIERDFLRDMNLFLVVHMDPIEVDDVVVNQTRVYVAKVVRSLEPEATIHDFRMTSGVHHTNLVFDLVVPHEYCCKQKEYLMKEIENKISEYDQQCHCIITCEYSYIDMSK